MNWINFSVFKFNTVSLTSDAWISERKSQRFDLILFKKLFKSRFNKQSPTQVVRFWRRSILKLNPERIVEKIPEQIFLV